MLKNVFKSLKLKHEVNMLKNVKFRYSFKFFAEEIEVDLNESIVVLVGKNGAGKSVILESIFSGIKTALGEFSLINSPIEFECKLKLKGYKEIITYKYNISQKDKSILSNSNSDFVLKESCFFSDNSEIWTTNDEIVTFQGEEILRLPSRKSLLSVDTSDIPKLSKVVNQIRSFFLNTYLVRAGIPRIGQRKDEITGGLEFNENNLNRAEYIKKTLINWYINNELKFEELTTILKKYKAISSLEIQVISRVDSKFRRKEKHENISRDDLIFITVDNVNIGSISDGILRIIEIIIYLIQGESGVLLIEEPETAIHPGMLSKILSTINSYSFQRQIILSTHSKQVVDWSTIKSIRFIESDNGRINSMKLNKESIKNLQKYLDDNLSISDFIYSGNFT
jgi:predicted ATP-dependent endonuclease of OLD family